MTEPIQTVGWLKSQLAELPDDQRLEFFAGSWIEGKAVPHFPISIYDGPPGCTNIDLEPWDDPEG